MKLKVDYCGTGHLQCNIVHIGRQSEIRNFIHITVEQSLHLFLLIIILNWTVIHFQPLEDMLVVYMSRNGHHFSSCAASFDQHALVSCTKQFHYLLLYSSLQDCKCVLIFFILSLDVNACYVCTISVNKIRKTCKFPTRNCRLVFMNARK